MSRLADASSAYLRSAAHQPVNWHPWGDEAFDRARAEDKPILLDIGAVWCHWCHVMDRESYEDPAIAEALNRDWVCVKVDRDERPDVDARYQRAVQAVTGQGGWPLTGFLTPAGEVFYGGTYFPPDGKYGRPGFAAVLAELSRAYRQERDKVGQQAEMIRRHLEEHAHEARPGAPARDVVARAVDAMARVFDFQYGGFGAAPKFPHPAALELLLVRWADAGLTWPREMVDRTLVAMARGGVYDQLGGGFHRYAVDQRWIVPHFEKMSYDNSELLRIYAHAAASLKVQAGEREGGSAGEASAGPPARRSAFDEPPMLYRRTTEGIVAWVMTVLSDPAGGYFASQDADVGLDDDGDYFTWTLDEVKGLVTEGEREALVRRFDIEEQGEMQHDPRRNVLWVRRAMTEVAASLGPEAGALVRSGLAKLAEARARRPAPAVDRTIYTGWSAMMASAMLEAGALLDRADLDRHALVTLERLLAEAADPAGGVRHALGGSGGGLLEDQVHLAAAALDAFEATGKHRWLAQAVALADHVWDRYRGSRGGLRDRREAAGQGFLPHEIVSAVDAPTPSPNGVAALVLARLAEHTGDPRWTERRDELLGAFGGGLGDLGLHGATLLRAADWALAPATHVAVVAHPDEAGRALRRAARMAYRPRKVVTLLEPGAPAEALPAPLRAMVTERVPRAYVCVGPQCHAPVDDPAALLELLAAP